MRNCPPPWVSVTRRLFPLPCLKRSDHYRFANSKDQAVKRGFQLARWLGIRWRVAGQLGGALSYPFDLAPIDFDHVGGGLVAAVPGDDRADALRCGPQRIIEQMRIAGGRPRLGVAE